LQEKDVQNWFNRWKIRAERCIKREGERCIEGEKRKIIKNRSQKVFRVKVSLFNSHTSYTCEIYYLPACIGGGGGWDPDGYRPERVRLETWWSADYYYHYHYQHDDDGLGYARCRRGARDFRRRRRSPAGSRRRAGSATLWGDPVLRRVPRGARVPSESKKPRLRVKVDEKNEPNTSPSNFRVHPPPPLPVLPGRAAPPEGLLYPWKDHVIVRGSTVKTARRTRPKTITSSFHAAHLNVRSLSIYSSPPTPSEQYHLSTCVLRFLREQLRSKVLRPNIAITYRQTVCTSILWFRRSVPVFASLKRC